MRNNLWIIVVLCGGFLAVSTLVENDLGSQLVAREGVHHEEHHGEHLGEHGAGRVGEPALRRDEFRHGVNGGYGGYGGGVVAPVAAPVVVPTQTQTVPVTLPHNQNSINQNR